MKAIRDILSDRDSWPDPPGDLPEFDDDQSTGCQRCGGSGRVVTPRRLGHPGFGKSQLCGCLLAPEKATDRRAETLRRVGVPNTFARASFDRWDVARGGSGPINAARAFVSSWPPPKPVLLLTGKSGGGKTHLATAILGDIYDRYGHIGQFWPVTEFLDRIKATFDEAARTETTAQAEERLRAAPLLVLDDLGAEKATDYANERLFQLVDYRWRENKPLVVTTNIASDGFPTRLRSRLESGVVVVFGGKDYRTTTREVAS